MTSAQHRLPAVYEYRGYVVEGGLLSYGADLRENFRRAALYVDRILKGTRPADLPVDQASRFERWVNGESEKGPDLSACSNSRPAAGAARSPRRHATEP